eukprot:9673658-Alexandrium_andersonii.AAC.1
MAPANLTARGHAISAIKHRDFYMERLGSEVSTKHAEHIFKQCFTLDKGLHRLTQGNIHTVLADEA